MFLCFWNPEFKVHVYLQALSQVEQYKRMNKLMNLLVLYKV